MTETFTTNMLNRVVNQMREHERNNPPIGWLVWRDVGGELRSEPVCVSEETAASHATTALPDQGSACR